MGTQWCLLKDLQEDSGKVISGPGVMASVEEAGQARAQSHLPGLQRCAHGPTVKGPAKLGKLVAEHVVG